MTVDDMVKIFTNNFGETEEDFNTEKFVAVSANRILGLVKLNEFHEMYSSFRRYTIQDMPKENKDKQCIVKHGKYLFYLDYVRSIIKLFFNNEAFNAITGNAKIPLLIFKLGDYGIILGGLIDNNEVSPYEIIYNWNDIFLEFTIQSDMIL